MELELKNIISFDECRDFVSGFYDDPEFSEPMLTNEEQLKNNLVKAIENPKRHWAFGIFRDGQMIGLFVFLMLRDEQYMEMLVGLSRDREAYHAVFGYLEQNYTAYDVDFVFNPRNYLLTEMLKNVGAKFDPEQQKMVWGHSLQEVDTMGVELFSEKYAQQYFAMHSQDVYWTGEKVVEAPEKFRTLLAIHEGSVVGYIDVTHCFEENEPYDLLVLEEHRRKGYGRKLLAKALEMNGSSGMMLLVDVDNTAAVHLYESLGFEKVKNQNNLTAHWTVPAVRSRKGGL